MTGVDILPPYYRRYCFLTALLLFFTPNNSRSTHDTCLSTYDKSIIVVIGREKLSLNDTESPPRLPSVVP